MKKNYDAPIALLLFVEANDIITTSAGDTPEAPFEW